MKTIKLTKKEYKKLIKSVVEKTAQDILAMVGESTTIIYRQIRISACKRNTSRRVNEPRCWICEFRDIQKQETFHPCLVPDSNSVNRKGISDMNKTRLTQSKSPEAKGT